MANYYGNARSNYFKVKDAEEFKKWVETCSSVAYWEKGDTFAIYSDCPDGGGWSSSRYDEDLEDYLDLDLSAELAEHLQEGEVAILIETGAEKLRYLCGVAIAVNWKGEYEILNLDTIYGMVEERWGIKPTRAEY